MNTLGILGGMGPEAGLQFCSYVLELARTHGARTNADYPHFLLSNLPVPDLIRDRNAEETAVRMVEEETRRLRTAGADTIVLACNTMHLFADRFVAASDGKFLSMVDAVTAVIRRDGVRRVGLLGSHTTMQSGLYAEPLRSLGVQVILPDETGRKEVVEIIFRIIAGEAGEEDRDRLHAIIAALREQGAEAVLLGCTELPLLVDPSMAGVPVYNSLRILAEAVFSFLS
jgi:aspartate racemase